MNQATERLVKKLTIYDNILDIEKTNEQIKEITLNITILRIVLHVCLRLCNEFDIQEDIISLANIFSSLKDEIMNLVNETTTVKAVSYTHLTLPTTPYV